MFPFRSLDELDWSLTMARGAGWHIGPFQDLLWCDHVSCQVAVLVRLLMVYNWKGLKLRIGPS